MLGSFSTLTPSSVFGGGFCFFFFTKHSPAAAGSMACQGLTKPQSGYKLSCLRSRDGDIKQKKRKGGSALSNLPQGGLQLNYNVFGYLQQLSSMVRLMCEREIQTAQKVWLLESWMQLLSWWHFPVISTGKYMFYPLNKQMLFKDTSYTPYWPSLYLAAYLIWFKILWYGKAFWDFPQDPPKPQNTVFMGSLQIFFTRSHKSLWKDSSQGIKGILKICLPTFHGEKKEQRALWCNTLVTVICGKCHKMAHSHDMSGSAIFCSETLTQASQRQPFIPKSTHHSEIMLVVRLHVANVQPVCLDTANEWKFTNN